MLFELSIGMTVNGTTTETMLVELVILEMRLVVTEEDAIIDRDADEDEDMECSA